VGLRSGFTRARPIDRRLTLWLGSLAALAALNVGLWLWIARSASLRTPYAETQLLLSGIYVGVCDFRSLFPRVDLERRCLWDTWLFRHPARPDSRYHRRAVLRLAVRIVRAPAVGHHRHAAA
jgi:hypothetical protein